MTSTASGPAYSIASCVVETAHRLIAAPDLSGIDNTDTRRAGKALLTAEVLGFNRAKVKKPGTQGLELRLGFYDPAELDYVASHEEKVVENIGYSIGGFPWGIQISLELIQAQNGWMGGGVDWPAAKPYQHLDMINRDVDKRCKITDPGLLQVIGRRLRYRLGVDHASGVADAFWWTTPQTEEWIARVLSKEKSLTLDASSRRDFNGTFSELLSMVVPTAMNADPCLNSPDDWGYVDLARDPISILTVGPYSNAQTHSDVAETLKRAGRQLKVTSTRVRTSERETSNPGTPYAEALEVLASTRHKRRECDVVILYRGGFSAKDPVDRHAAQRILDAAEQLVVQGIEVILGMGHGTTSIHGIAQRHPAVGVYEAVTPTAAANWVLKEHVNQRLMNSSVDTGQPTVI